MTQEANPGLVRLERVRLSFPHLAAPHASAVGSVAKFSGDFILEPTHPGYAAFMAQLQAVALSEFGAQADAALQFASTDRKLRCYGAGEEVINKDTMQPYNGYPGNVYIKANNEVQPAMFGADGVQVMDARQFYGGCYVNAQIKPWPQNNTHGKTVRCELVGIQFHSDGEAFGVAPIDPASLGFGAVAGAPAAVAPGVAGVVASQVAVAPGQPMPALLGTAPLGVPGTLNPPVATPGYDPAAHPVAPVAQPAPVIPGAVQPMAPPPGVAPAMAPGINPATGLPY